MAIGAAVAKLGESPEQDRPAAAALLARSQPYVPNLVRRCFVAVPQELAGAPELGPGKREWILEQADGCIAQTVDQIGEMARGFGNLQQLFAQATSSGMGGDPITQLDILGGDLTQPGRKTGAIGRILWLELVDCSLQPRLQGRRSIAAAIRALAASATAAAGSSRSWRYRSVVR